MGETLMSEVTKVDLNINGSLLHVELGQGRLMPRVGFLGPEGTYTEEAKCKFLDRTGHRFDESFLEKNSDVVKKIDLREFDLGIVPSENSIEGDVVEVIKELVKMKEASILAEYLLPIKHALIGRPGETIGKIYSHIQGLGQCSDFLSHYSNVELIGTTSTAKAVEEISIMSNSAAIANERAAGLYNIPVLARNIGNNPNNTTRFYLIGRGETEPTGEDLTTMLIAPNENRVGLLWSILGVLAVNGINLTNIRSRSVGDPKMERYIFLATCSGHQRDSSLASALNTLQSKLDVPVRVLGSYKKAQLAEGAKEPGVLNGG